MEGRIEYIFAKALIKKYKNVRFFYISYLLSR